LVGKQLNHCPVFAKGALSGGKVSRGVAKTNRAYTFGQEGCGAFAGVEEDVNWCLEREPRGARRCTPPPAWRPGPRLPSSAAAEKAVAFLRLSLTR
jgi:hypothetical protein